MKILVALDSGCEKLIKEAARMARERAASLTALFVLDSTWPDFIGHDWLSGSNARAAFLDYVAQEEQSGAAWVIAQLNTEPDVAWEIKIAAGRITDRILEEAQNGYDLLMISTPFERGLEVLRRPLAALVSSAPCSVYLVRK